VSVYISLNYSKFNVAPDGCYKTMPGSELIRDENVFMSITGKADVVILSGYTSAPLAPYFGAVK